MNYASPPNNAGLTDANTACRMHTVGKIWGGYVLGNGLLTYQEIVRPQNPQQDSTPVVVNHTGAVINAMPSVMCSCTLTWHLTSHDEYTHRFLNSVSHNIANKSRHTLLNIIIQCFRIDSTSASLLKWHYTSCVCVVHAVTSGAMLLLLVTGATLYSVIG